MAVENTGRHISKLNIDCYRGLKNLCLDGLNDINILTGNNNSGKTSVLEVLSGLGNPNSISTWIRMCRLGRNGNYYMGLLNLFPTEADNMEIRISYNSVTKAVRSDTNSSGAGGVEEFTDEKKRVRLRCVTQHEITLEAVVQDLRISGRELEKINGRRQPDFSDENLYIETKRIHLKIRGSSNPLLMQEYDIYDFQTGVPAEQSARNFFPAVYIAPSEHTDGKLLLDEVMESPALYQELMKILHEFDDSIINITKSGSASEYIILSTRHKKAMPLSVYGDGMKKALVLLAAVVKAKDGILLLDEFETAIHTSAMNHIFSWILQSAQKLNVQVFLTSHSLEAIGRVLRCDPQLQDKINLYTLYKKDGKNLVRKMCCAEAVKAQDDWGVELR